jgi:hypothetical protein
MNKKIIMALGILLLILVLFFFPKKNGYEVITIAGHQGEKDCACFGFEDKYVEFLYPKCSDCGHDYYCFGIPTGNCVCERVNRETGRFETADCN